MTFATADLIKIGRLFSGRDGHHDTAEIAAIMQCDEQDIYNALSAARAEYRADLAWHRDSRMMTAKLFLPWPDKTLSPNSRVHWSSLHRAKRKAKNDAFFAVKEAGIGKIDASSLTVRYSFYPPSHRTYDLDNLVSSMKAAADGIALAIGVDDGKWNIEISPRGPVERNGMVKVELEWAP